MTTEEILAQLNAYDGDPEKGQDIWNDVILGLDEYDENAEASQASSSDQFGLFDGTVIRHDGSSQTWYEQS